jgi:hypothetical protein
MISDCSYHHHRTIPTLAIQPNSTTTIMSHPPFSRRRYLLISSSSYYSVPTSTTTYYSAPTLTYPLIPPNPYTPSFHAPDLPSRIAALNRRATLVSTHLAHLTAVVKTLETTKPEHLNQGQLWDMHAEGAGLVSALKEFEEVVDEVLKGLVGVLEEREGYRARDGRRVREEEWRFEGWERGRRTLG